MLDLVTEKTALVDNLIVNENVYPDCITETCLGDEEDGNLSLICPPGFEVQHHPWANGWGGHVAAICQKSLVLTRRTV